MDKKLQDAINEQIKNELYSAYLYLSMAAYFESENLGGFANWMKKQAKEEQEHAMKFFEFLNDRGARVVLKKIDQPPVNFSSPKDVFKETLEHEKKVTSLINKLYALAEKLKDNSAIVLLHWYITEQVEEEKNATTILEKLKMLRPSSAELLMLDAELGKRE